MPIQAEATSTSAATPIECRINAEDPDKRLHAVRAGKVGTWQRAGRAQACSDRLAHRRAGATASPRTYDSMVGKLIVHGDSRIHAIDRMSRALDEFEVGPIKTTIPLHRNLMKNSSFRDGGTDIHFLERLLK